MFDTDSLSHLLPSQYVTSSLDLSIPNLKKSNNTAYLKSKDFIFFQVIYQKVLLLGFVITLIFKISAALIWVGILYIALR